MRMTVVVLLSSASVLAAGCSSGMRETWSKPGATRQDIARDASDCERVATVDPTHGQEQGAYGAGGPRRNASVFESCMRAHGY
jgi:hypothetical protein